jgi:hypothetical protein
MAAEDYLPPGAAVLPRISDYLPPSHVHELQRRLVTANQNLAELAQKHEAVLEELAVFRRLLSTAVGALKQLDAAVKHYVPGRSRGPIEEVLQDLRCVLRQHGVE